MTTLSIVIPCYNEERTLEACVERVLAIGDAELALELIIVDDGSEDATKTGAERLASKHPELVVLHHARNQGVGAALRTGIARATGDFVAFQHAGPEYDPDDLKRLLVALKDGDADVVLGSRFLSAGSRRVQYFWHALGNRLSTLLSNMLTDLDLTDMQSCYKVFRREVIQSIELREEGVGFQAEVVAKLAELRPRIQEMGISYSARTGADGKQLAAKDGIRTLYCILKYNLPKAPVPIQFFFYLFIGGTSALFDLSVFVLLFRHTGVVAASLIAFFAAAGLNYLLSIALLFRHRARWSSFAETFVFVAVVCVIAAFDVFTTKALLAAGLPAAGAKAGASAASLVFNFLGRKYVVFPEKASARLTTTESAVTLGGGGPRP